MANPIRILAAAALVVGACYLILALTLVFIPQVAAAPSPISVGRVLLERLGIAGLLLTIGAIAWRTARRPSPRVQRPGGNAA
jgi:hypothetical protein